MIERLSSYSSNMGLNDREKLVLNTKIMRLSEKESLQYLEAHKESMSVPTYYRILAHIEGETRKRLYEIAKEMTALHMERIDELERIKKEMWINYHKESEPRFKVKILREIKEMQPYISAYHEATKDILEDAVRRFANEEYRSISTIN